MRRFRLLLLGLAVAVVATAVVAAALHGYAWSQYRASFGAAPYGERLGAARRSLAIEPWEKHFQARLWWVIALHRREMRRAADAYYLMHRAADIDNTDPALRADLHKTFLSWVEATDWKAHVQHGRELTGGVLPEERVIK